MTKAVYRVVRHEGGWAYEANGTYSRVFRTREQAREAARVAGREQGVQGHNDPHASDRAKAQVAG